MKRITILLAEDHTIVRQGLKLLIEEDGDIKVVGEAQTGREAVQMTHDLRPDIVVMDIGMPMLNGLEATRQILKSIPEIKVLILSAHNDAEYVEQVAEMGARGYIVKQASGDVLARAIRELQKGKTFFTSSTSNRLNSQCGRSLDRDDVEKRPQGRLTPREMELLQLISEGRTNKAISFELQISVKTVEKHRQHLMQKLDLHDIASLTRFAIAHGIIECGIQTTIVPTTSSS